jgi:hypothetical protein
MRFVLVQTEGGKFWRWIGMASPLKSQDLAKPLEGSLAPIHQFLEGPEQYRTSEPYLYDHGLVRPMSLKNERVLRYRQLQRLNADDPDTERIGALIVELTQNKVVTAERLQAKEAAILPPQVMLTRSRLRL